MSGPTWAEAAAQMCSVKKVVLEISQSSQENTCARVSFLIKLQAFAKKETLVQMFSVNFVKFLITRFFTELLRWLFLSRPALHKEITCEMLAMAKVQRL